MQKPSQNVPIRRSRSSLARLLRKGLAGLLVAGGLVGGSASAASAHEFGLLKTDGRHTTYSSDEDTDADWRIWKDVGVNPAAELEYEDKTVLNMVRKARWGWNDHTDIVWFATRPDHLGGDDVGGDEVCRKTSGWVWNRKCDRARVRFNETVPDNFGDDIIFEIACHEFGHALGFEHLNDGCMAAAARGNISDISQHQIDHINDHY